MTNTRRILDLYRLKCVGFTNIMLKNSPNTGNLIEEMDSSAITQLKDLMTVKEIVKYLKKDVFTSSMASPNSHDKDYEEKLAQAFKDYYDGIIDGK